MMQTFGLMRTATAPRVSLSAVARLNRGAHARAPLGLLPAIAHGDAPAVLGMPRPMFGTSIALDFGAPRRIGYSVDVLQARMGREGDARPAQRSSGGRGGRGEGRGGRGRSGGRGRGRGGGAASPVRRQQKEPVKIPENSAPPRQVSSDMGVAKHLSDTTFESLPISEEAKRAVTEMLGFTHLTHVQSATLPYILAGEDVLAKAKTGTGKTIAFLIPAIESLIKNPPRDRGDISVLVVAPTRELVNQIAAEAGKVLAFQDLAVQSVIGGTNINAELKRLNNQPCDVLVGTPGRLIDHLENKGLRGRMRHLRTLVLDEADWLLEMGFRNSINTIIGCLPRQRQSLLFSATVPQAVHQVSALALNDSHKFVDTVGDEVDDTHANVDQRWLAVDMDQQLPTLYQILRDAMKEPDHKIIVFFPVARMVQFMCRWAEEMGISAYEMHSRKSQSHRTRIANEFRAKSGVIMFSSDVSARGMDFPDVSLVLQVGMPSAKEQYVHRLGRTARAGKVGHGVLMLSPFETGFLEQMHDVAIQPMLPPTIDGRTVDEVLDGVARVGRKEKEMMYQAYLGFYNSAGLKMSKAQLVATANEYITTCANKTKNGT